MLTAAEVQAAEKTAAAYSEYSKADLMEFRDVFDLFNPSGAESMSVEDLKQFFELLELEPTPDTHAADLDGVEGISFEEFLPIVAPVQGRLSRLIL